jgi:hypothetical protein
VLSAEKRQDKRPKQNLQDNAISSHFSDGATAGGVGLSYETTFIPNDGAVGWMVYGRPQPLSIRPTDFFTGILFCK